MDVTEYRKVKAYIDQNLVAILGTINPDGTPSGAAIYVCTDPHHPIVYFITKQGTKKYQNLKIHSHVSLTVVNPSESSTLQANGRAFVVEDTATIDMVMKIIAHDHVTTKEWLPPIAKLRAGAYVVIGIELSYARLGQFQGKVIGDEHIFTQ